MKTLPLEVETVFDVYFEEEIGKSSYILFSYLLKEAS